MDAPEYTLVPHSPIRKAIAARVSESHSAIPVFDLHIEVDASAMVNTRTSFKEQGGEIIPSYNDMLIYCTSRCLEKHPALNAHYAEEGVKRFQDINIGFAAAAPEGVLLPVLRNANKKGLFEIAKEAKELSEQAKKMRLRASFQMHGTFTLSSLGAFGIDSFNGVISPPQVGILAAGAIIKKPWVKEDNIAAVDTLHLTLTVDHRAVDGAVAACFLKDLGDLLQILEINY